MSRHYRDNRRETRGHGVLGFFLTLILIVAILGVFVIFFTGDSMNGLKGTVYGVFYPQKFTEEVKRSSAEFQVDEALIYAVMRTESGFRPEVESHAGAVGLMQLMPSTFDWLQEKLDGEVTQGKAALTDPSVNVRYGTYFLSILLERYGDIHTVACAYNAGTTTVDNWLDDPSCTLDGRTLTRVPYEETEHYAEKVLDAYEMYRKLYYS